MLGPVPDLVELYTGGDEFSDVGYLFDLIATRPAWHADAAFRESHPGATWFPEKGQDPRAGSAARAVCRECLVVDECGAWALAQGPELAGLWGGLTALDRAKARRPGGRRSSGDLHRWVPLLSSTREASQQIRPAAHEGARHP